MTSDASSNKLTSPEECAPGSKKLGTGALGQTQPLFFFFHVPKTGGATIISTFKKKFGSERVFDPGRNKNSLVDVMYARKCLIPPEVRQGQLSNSHVAGHFASLSIIEGRESQYHKACFWRHPADWFLSYYNWRNNRDKDRQKRTYDFSDFVKSQSHNPMSQDFLLYCGDVPGWRYFFASDYRKFQEALSLADKFDLFADISSVNDYLQSTCSAGDEGIENRNRIPGANKALKSLDAETRRRLELLNPVDYYICRVALGENREQIISEAKKALIDKFQFRDLTRLIVRPYFRLKVKFIPFFNLPLRLGL